MNRNKKVVNEINTVDYSYGEFKSLKKSQCVGVRRTTTLRRVVYASL